MKKNSKGKSLLKQYRERLDPRPTQEDVAQKVPMSLRAYQEIEGGTAIPGLDKAVRICSILKISIQDFCKAKGLDIDGLPLQTIDPIEKEV